jgi:hypothetical protein
VRSAARAVAQSPLLIWVTLAVGLMIGIDWPPGVQDRLAGLGANFKQLGAEVLDMLVTASERRQTIENELQALVVSPAEERTVTSAARELAVAQGPIDLEILWSLFRADEAAVRRLARLPYTPAL